LRSKRAVNYKINDSLSQKMYNALALNLQKTWLFLSGCCKIGEQHILQILLHLGGDSRLLSLNLLNCLLKAWR